MKALYLSPGLPSPIGIAPPDFFPIKDSAARTFSPLSARAARIYLHYTSLHSI